MHNDFPDFTNFYSSFDSPTKHGLKGLLEQHGWTSRKESWEDFELINEWSEFNLHANETKPILTGTIKVPEINYKILLELFRNANAKFIAELYDKDHVLIYNDKTI
jgi:hypothetical protein